MITASPAAAALLQKEDVGPLHRILTDVNQAAAWIQEDGADWDRAAKWRQACEQAVQERKWAEAEAFLKRYRFVVESGGKAGEEAKKWMADRQAEWEAGCRLEALHADWESRQLDGLAKRIGDFLRQDGGRILVEQKKELERILAEINVLEQVQERERLVTLQAAELEGRRLKLAQVVGEALERQPLADLAVDAARSTLMKGHLAQAFAFVMEAWRIHPGNARTQIVLSEALLGRVVGGLAVLLPVLLFYAVVSNRIYLFFFKRRLKAYRIEEERLLQR